MEYWKRKTAEINNRWGTLELMNLGSEVRIIREEFIGDEGVDHVTGDVTIHKMPKTELDQIIEVF